MLIPRIFLIVLIMSSSYTISADSWDLVQSVIVTSDINLSQGSANSSHQALNNIVSTGALNSARQSVTSNRISLTQDGSNNIQSLNKVSGSSLNGSLRQSVSASSVTFNSNGSSNIQTGNYIKGDSINRASQQFNADTVSFIGAGSGNIQAGNYIRADKANANPLTFFSSLQ